MNQIGDLRTELRAFVEEKNRQILRTMNKDIETKVSAKVREALSVPDLIGEKERYSTFQNFITQFHNGTIHK